MHDDIWHSKNHQPYLVETGSNVTLTCTAKSPRDFSSELYTIYWLFNLKHLKKNDCINGKNSRVATCNLTLLWPDVVGKYTCLAGNKNGCTSKQLELKVAGESRLIQVSNCCYYYYCYYYIIIIKRPMLTNFACMAGPVARKYHEKACKRSVIRKKKVVMISEGHRREKIQVKLVKIGPLIDNIIIIIIIIAFAERHPNLHLLLFITRKQVFICVKRQPTARRYIY